MNWESLDTDDSSIKKIAEHIVSEINKLTKPHRHLCAELKLKKILRAQKLAPEENMLLFKKTNDADGFRADLTDKTDLDNTTYQMWVYTTPGDGLFEVTVNHVLHNNTFVMDDSTMSRVNKYGDAPKCIEKEHEDLRKYCYCYK